MSYNQKKKTLGINHGFFWGIPASGYNPSFFLGGFPGVVDSGSSRHIDAATVVTDESDTYHVSGFDGSEAWTKGSGNLALELTDASTKRPFTVILDDVDKFE